MVCPHKYEKEPSCIRCIAFIDDKCSWGQEHHKYRKVSALQQKRRSWYPFPLYIGLQKIASRSNWKEGENTNSFLQDMKVFESTPFSSTLSVKKDMIYGEFLELLEGMACRNLSNGFYSWWKMNDFGIAYWKQRSTFLLADKSADTIVELKTKLNWISFNCLLGAFSLEDFWPRASSWRFW